MTLAEGLSEGRAGSLASLKKLYQAIVDREEQGESLSRLLPGGVADKLRAEGRRIGETEELEVTVVMADIRGYTSIAEHTSPTVLAGQLNEHRAEMNRAIIENGGTVMQFVGDAVMAVFGAPVAVSAHAQKALLAAGAMHEAQANLNSMWEVEGREPFGIGIGLSTGRVAAAVLGSEERIEYTVIGDTVNLAQRIQQWARPGETVISQATWEALDSPPRHAEALDPAQVKGREAPVAAYRLAGSST